MGDTDGLGSRSLFWKPTGVAVSPDGILYIADSLNDRISKGVLSTATSASIPAVQSTPTPSDPMGWLAANKGFWPKQAVLKQAVDFPVFINGRVAGTVRAGVGSVVQVKEVTANEVIAAFNGTNGRLAAGLTDIPGKAEVIYSKQNASNQTHPVTTVELTKGESANTPSQANAPNAALVSGDAGTSTANCHEPPDDFDYGKIGEAGAIRTTFGGVTLSYLPEQSAPFVSASTGSLKPTDILLGQTAQFDFATAGNLLFRVDSDNPINSMALSCGMSSFEGFWIEIRDSNRRLVRSSGPYNIGCCDAAFSIPVPNLNHFYLTLRAMKLIYPDVLSIKMLKFDRLVKSRDAARSDESEMQGGAKVRLKYAPRNGTIYFENGFKRIYFPLMTGVGPYDVFFDKAVYFGAANFEDLGVLVRYECNSSSIISKVVISCTASAHPACVIYNENMEPLQNVNLSTDGRPKEIPVPNLKRFSIELSGQRWFCLNYIKFE